ncbi:MAG: hypothetical protein HWN68_17350 [Desulfobacterales bacterium]|nr:hypothetical protein [Desulfobacterales bacterium]
MDIDKISRRIHTTKFATVGKVKEDKTFGQVLDRTMNQVPREEGPKDGCHPVAEVVSAGTCEVCHVDGRAVQHASKLLDLLEKYAEALNSPQMTLKSIEPMVVRIQQELNGLDVRSILHTGQHDEFARLINQIAVTASVEAFKFQRGDYIA